MTPQRALPAMGRIVISCYRPKAGSEDALRELMRNHVARLRAIALVTDRAPIMNRQG